MTQRPLLLPAILLMLGGSITIIIRIIVSRCCEIGDFFTGFLDGLAVGLAAVGIIAFVISLLCKKSNK
jgi:hypothetical protein